MEVALKIEEPLLRQLKERAGREGITIEELHNQILRDALLSKKEYTLADHLLAIPKGDDDIFDNLRNRTDTGRQVEL